MGQASASAAESWVWRSSTSRPLRCCCCSASLSQFGTELRMKKSVGVPSIPLNVAHNQGPTQTRHYSTGKSFKLHQIIIGLHRPLLKRYNDTTWKETTRSRPVLPPTASKCPCIVANLGSHSEGIVSVNNRQQHKVKWKGFEWFWFMRETWNNNRY